MGALTPADQRRLQGSLALLSSNRDGEVLAAVRAVERLLAKVDARFIDLVLPSDPPCASRRPEHQVRAERLLRCGYPWTDWTERFLNGVTEWRNPLSVRQADILAELEAEAGMVRAA